MRGGPLTARRLAKDTGLSPACSRYHLRALATAAAVRPFLKSTAKSNEVTWVLVPEKLPTTPREVLLGEVSLQTCFRLAHCMFFEGCHDVAELADRFGLSEDEVARHIKAMRMEMRAEGMRRFDAANRADRLSDFDPEWVDHWLEHLGEKDDEPSPREDGAE
jgi:hypothetical protein